MLAAVDFHGLFEVVWVSFVAGVGVTVLFSLAIYGFGRADEAAPRRRGDRRATWRSPSSRWSCSAPPSSWASP